MSKEKKKEQKKCVKKSKFMLAYGIIQLGTRAIAAISLTAIALSFCSINKEAKLFNECINTMKEDGRKTSSAVNFCNGGN